jgi:hypothetical protein
MNNLTEALKKYFETTPRDRVLENWEKSEAFDKIGPTMDEFLEVTNVHFKVKSEDPIKGCEIHKNEYGLKFSSGFFFN